MPRQLSMGEFIAFAHDVDVSRLDLPPWGGVIEWSGLMVLVYVAPGGRVFTTEVSDSPAIIRNTPRVYDPWSTAWYYHLPEETLHRATEVPGEVLEVTGEYAEKIAAAIGAAAAGALKPVVPTLTPLLIVAGVLGVLFLLKK